MFLTVYLSRGLSLSVLTALLRVAISGVVTPGGELPQRVTTLKGYHPREYKFTPQMLSRGVPGC